MKGIIRIVLIGIIVVVALRYLDEKGILVKQQALDVLHWIEAKLEDRKTGETAFHLNERENTFTEVITG